MNNPFNKLTAAQAERLAVLFEECGEIVQAVGKTLRHGYDSRHPHKPGPDNREYIQDEISDLVAWISFMVAHGDFTEQGCMRDIDARISAKLRYCHHQDFKPAPAKERAL